MEKIKLELPNEEREKDALDYIRELKEDGSGTDGDGGLDNAENYKEWVQKVKDYHNGINVPSHHVPATTYFVIRESDDRIIGMLDLRHYLNDYLRDSWMGHIGCSVRPGERRKGYATQMVKLALKECKKMGINPVVFGCEEDNIGSKKTVLKCGGKLMSKHLHDGKPHLGFEIKLGGNDGS